MIQNVIQQLRVLCVISIHHSPIIHILPYVQLKSGTVYMLIKSGLVLKQLPAAYEDMMSSNISEMVTQVCNRRESHMAIPAGQAPNHGSGESIAINRTIVKNIGEDFPSIHEQRSWSKRHNRRRVHGLRLLSISFALTGFQKHLLLPKFTCRIPGAPARLLVPKCLTSKAEFRLAYAQDVVASDSQLDDVSTFGAAAPVLNLRQPKDHLILR